MSIGTEIAKVVEAAETPITKLVEAICGAIGKAYEPFHHKRMTNAEVYRISEYSKVMMEYSNLPIKHTDEHLEIDISDYEALRTRAGQRLAYQEITKQENIETIADKAFAELEGKESQSDEKISPEWMNRFINTAGEISTEEMQNLWAKVLAGEAIKPNSYSLRTLECLRNLSAADARLFEKVSEFVIENSFLYNDREINNKYGITFSDILRLDDCGLINSNAFISRHRDTNTNPELFIDFGEYALLVASKDNIQVSSGQYPLTNNGIELLQIARKKLISLDYRKDVCSSVKKHNTNATLTLHKIQTRHGEQINCRLQDIMVVL